MSYQAPPPGGEYGQPGYNAQPPKTSTKAILALVFGILGIFPCSWLLIFGILGVVFGRMAQAEIAASGGTQTGAGMAKAGFICGIIGVVLGVLYWIGLATNVIHLGFSGSTS